MPSRKGKSEVIGASFIEPMLCLAASALPEGPEWEYEVKFDGYRAQGIKTAGRVQLRSRYNSNFNARFPLIARALEALPDETVIDGEIVAYDAEGHPSFNVLQNQLSEKPRLHLFAFDLMFLRGLDVMQRPLEERRRLLHRKLMPLLPDNTVRFSETLEASAAELRGAIREMGLEGVVAKLRASHYGQGDERVPGRRCASTGHFLSPDKMQRLLDGCNGENAESILARVYLKPFVIVALNTGMRRGEILGLRRAAVDWQNRMVALGTTKNGDSRHVST